MAKITTTDTLVANSKRRGFIPASQCTYTCQDIRDILNEEMMSYVAPKVMCLNESYYLRDTDVTVCACQTRYRIPYRAMGSKIKDVQFIDSSGAYYEITRVDVGDRPQYRGYNSGSQMITVYLEADEIVIMNSQQNTGTLRFSYYLRPNELVADCKVGVVTAVCVGCCTTTFTMSNFPCAFSCTTQFDIVDGKSPNKIRVFDACVTSVCSTAKTITFANAQIKETDPRSTTAKAITFAVGDTIAVAQETKYPQIPSELRPLLSQKAAIKMLEGLSDPDALTLAKSELLQMERDLGILIDNRIEAAPQKIVNRNGLLKSALFDSRSRRRGF